MPSLMLNGPFGISGQRAKPSLWSSGSYLCAQGLQYLKLFKFRQGNHVAKFKKRSKWSLSNSGTKLTLLGFNKWLVTLSFKQDVSSGLLGKSHVCEILPPVLARSNFGNYTSISLLLVADTRKPCATTWCQREPCACGWEGMRSLDKTPIS